jgi:cell pole-organizing protein PopZ
MANPNAAHEPSMEEILASIRQIISEDGEGSPGAKDEAARAEPSPEAPARTDSGPAPYETIVSRLEADPMPASQRSLAPDYTEITRPPQTPPSAAELSSEDRMPAPASRPAALARRPAQPEEQAGGLLSPEKSAAVSGAFGALTESLLGQTSRTLEDVVAEMLQPMLKSWLDDNLPGLVERMVQEEIERVSRGRR